MISLVEVFENFCLQDRRFNKVTLVWYMKVRNYSNKCIKCTCDVDENTIIKSILRMATCKIVYDDWMLDLRFSEATTSKVISSKYQWRIVVWISSVLLFNDRGQKWWATGKKSHKRNRKMWLIRILIDWIWPVAMCSSHIRGKRKTPPIFNSDISKCE